jgi:hypothetical protein
VFFWFHEKQESAGPATASMAVSYTLTKGKHVLLDKRVESTATLKPPTSHFNSFRVLRNSYSANVAEEVSQCLKKNIEKITQQLNEYLVAYYPYEKIAADENP